MFLEQRQETQCRWISAKPHVGLWIITAINEFISVGLHKQDLTSHAGLLSIVVFFRCCCVAVSTPIRKRPRNFCEFFLKVHKLFTCPS
ncbi:hypothetical protein MKW98_018126, partial [Papaver atlanticum]